MYLIFDTETTGLPKSYKAPMTDTENWPRCIQIAWQLHDDMGQVLEHDNFMVQPEGFNIPFDSEKIHGISTELAQEQGISLSESFSSYSQKKKENRSFVQKLFGDTLGSAITFLPYAPHTRKADFYGVSYFAVNYKSWGVNTFRNFWGDQNYSLSYKRTINFNERFLLSYVVGIMYGYDGRLGGNDKVPLSNTFLFNGKSTQSWAWSSI